MAERIHSAPCAMRTAQAEENRRAFRARWPHACATCEARGGVMLPDLLTGKDTFEGCHECLEVGLCPRCGSALRPPRLCDECLGCGWHGPENGEPLYPACLGCPPAAEVANG